MIQRFRDQRTADVWNGERNARTRQLPPEVLNIAPRKLDMLNAAATLDDMRAPPGNRLEALKSDLAEFHSIRINTLSLDTPAVLMTFRSSTTINENFVNSDLNLQPGVLRRRRSAAPPTKIGGP